MQENNNSRSRRTNPITVFRPAVVLDWNATLPKWPLALSLTLGDPRSSRILVSHVINSVSPPLNADQNLDSQDRQPAARDSLWELVRIVVLGVCLLSVVAAWVIPRSKPNAVLGRLSYTQSAVAVVATAAALSCLAIVFAAADRRRATGFRVTALWIGITGPLLLWEVGCLLMPADKLSDNPWYLWANGGSTGSDELIFERPPYLKWQGISNGDIAREQRPISRYAKTIKFETDFEGFRNSRDLKKADIVFIGDSCTEAGNVAFEDTFTEQVARQLNVDVRNLGRAHHAPTAELIILKKYGLKCDPKTVVWQFCETNDLHDEVRFQDWVDQGRPRRMFGEPLTAKTLWKRRSPSYSLFKLLRRSETWSHGGTFTDKQGESHPMLFIYRPEANHLPAGHPGWPLLERSLREGAELLSSRGIQLLVICIPMKIRVMGHATKLNQLTQTELGDNWDPPAEQTLAGHLQQLCKTLNVPFVDTTPHLRKHAEQGEIVYLPFDTHMSALGHKIVTKLLVESLAGQLPVARLPAAHATSSDRD